MSPKFAIAAAVLIGLCHSAEARIGETLDQCKKRYGEAILGPKTEHGITTATFGKNGILIQVEFDPIFEGKCNSIEFSKSGDALPDKVAGELWTINTAEFKTRIIKDNAEESHWKTVNGMFRAVLKKNHSLKITLNPTVARSSYRDATLDDLDGF